MTIKKIFKSERASKVRPFQDYWACEILSGRQHLWRHMADNKEEQYSSKVWRLKKLKL